MAHGLLYSTWNVKRKYDETAGRTGGAYRGNGGACGTDAGVRGRALHDLRASGLRLPPGQETRAATLPGGK